MSRIKTRLLTFTGVCTALIFVFTAFIHIPSYAGYVHLGDTFLFMAAAILPTPYAVFAGAAGAALSDVLTGYAVWAPASLIIKAGIVLFFTGQAHRILAKRNLLALIPALILTVAGYYLYEGLISGNFIFPLRGILGNSLQIVFSSALFVIAGVTMDRLHVKEKIYIDLKVCK